MDILHYTLHFYDLNEIYITCEIIPTNFVSVWLESYFE